MGLKWAWGVTAAALVGCTLGESVDDAIGFVPDWLRGYCVARYPEQTDLGFFDAQAGGEFLLDYADDVDGQPQYSLVVVDDCGAVKLSIEPRDETFESACTGAQVVHEVVAVKDTPVYDDIDLGQRLCTIPAGTAVPVEAVDDTLQVKLHPVQLSAEVGLAAFQEHCPGHASGVIRGVWVQLGQGPVPCLPMTALIRRP